MAREMSAVAEAEIRVRLVISNPVPDVLHSLQEDDAPLDPRRSKAGEPLEFAFPLRIAHGPRFLGKQVRREGKLRRFFYVRIGLSAGDHGSVWNRRMKIDIHDVDPGMLELAMRGAELVATIDGTAKDGTPACATIKPVRWSVA